MMIEEIKEDLLKYISDKYYDASWLEKTGDGEFNKGFDDDIKIDVFSSGRFRTISNDFLLIQCASVAGNRELLPSLGAVDWGTQIVINIVIEKSVMPENAAYISDKYIEKLYDIFQEFIYNYTRYTPVNPNAQITKFYSSSNGSNFSDFNSITKLIINADLAFTCKKQDLTIKEVS